MYSPSPNFADRAAFVAAIIFAILSLGVNSDIFVAIFVIATKRRAQIQVYPISLGRRLLADRQLSLRCIPSHPAPSFALAPALHRYQGRNLFLRTSRWLLLEASYIL